jgi:hypothetical protein
MDRAGKPTGEYEIFADGFAARTKRWKAPPTARRALRLAPTAQSISAMIRVGLIWRIVKR